jgi:hypothetical protein
MKKTLAILLLLSLVVGCGKSEQAKSQPIPSPAKAPVTQSKPPPHQTVANFSNSHISEELSHLSEELSSLFHDLDFGVKAIDFYGVKPNDETAVKPIKATKFEDVRIIVSETAFCWEEIFSSPARAVAAAEQAATWRAIATLATYLTSTTEEVKEDGFSTLTENNISGMLTYQVKNADDEFLPTVTVRMVMIPSARNTLPPIHVKQIKSAYDFVKKETSREQIWINNVLVIDKETTRYLNGEATFHYRQWHSHGWKWIDVTFDDKGTVKGRSWRESGIVEQEKQ